MCIRDSTCTELINQNKCFVVSIFNEVFHIDKVGTIRTQIIINTLFITNIDQYIFKNACFSSFSNRYCQSALKHILKQSDRFETYRFPSGVGTRNKQYSVFLIELNFEGDNFSAG